MYVFFSLRVQNFDGKTRGNVLRILDVYKEILHNSEYSLGFALDETSQLGHLGYTNKTLMIYCNL